MAREVSARFLFACCAIALAAPLSEAATRPAASESVRVRGLAGMPLRFEPNVGQAGPHAEYVARAPGQLLALRSGSAALSLEMAPPRERASRAGRRRSRDGADASTVVESVVLRLVGASPTSEPRPEGARASRSNYLLGPDPAAWRSGVPHFDAVRYADAWPGVDALWHGRHGRIEVDFELEAGVDPAVVRVRLDGGNCLHVDQDGELVVELTGGRMRLPRPVAWQGDGPLRSPVAVAYALADDRTFGFTLGPFDRSRPLTIDPVVTWS